MIVFWLEMFQRIRRVLPSSCCLGYLWCYTFSMLPQFVIIAVIIVFCWFKYEQYSNHRQWYYWWSANNIIFRFIYSYSIIIMWYQHQCFTLGTTTMNSYDLPHHNIVTLLIFVYHDGCLLFAYVLKYIYYKYNLIAFVYNQTTRTNNWRYTLDTNPVSIY